MSSDTQTHFILINSSFSIINFSIPSNHSNQRSLIQSHYLSLAQILQYCLVVQQIMIAVFQLLTGLLLHSLPSVLLSQHYGRMRMTVWSMEYEYFNIQPSKYLSSNPTFSMFSELRDSSARLIKLGGLPSFTFITISGEYEFLSCCNYGNINTSANYNTKHSHTHTRNTHSLTHSHILTHMHVCTRTHTHKHTHTKIINNDLFAIGLLIAINQT